MSVFESRRLTRLGEFVSSSALGTLKTYLLQGLVVDEASSILGNLELAFLDLLAKLPGGGRHVSMRSLG